MADGACEDRIYEEDAALAEMRTEEARLNEVQPLLRGRIEGPLNFPTPSEFVADQIDKALSDIDAASVEMLKQAGREETHVVLPITVLGSWMALLRGGSFPETEEEWTALQANLQDQAKLLQERDEEVPHAAPKVFQCPSCRGWHREPACG